MTIEGELRVWWIGNPPREPELYPVANVGEAKAKIEELTARDLADKTVTDNIGGIEVFEYAKWNNMQGEWTDYNDETTGDIMEIMRKEEE